MNLYNFIEYSDKYVDTTVSLYHYKRPEQSLGANNTSVNVTTANSSSFKYQSGLIKIDSEADGNNRIWKNVKIAIRLKYISNFYRSLELPLINIKLYIELNWSKHCIVSTQNNSTFKITKTELYVPVVTLSTDNNKKLSDLLKKEFKRSVFWNEYKSKIQTVRADANDNDKRILLNASF